MKRNERDERGEKRWNEINGGGKKGETPRKTSPDLVSSTTKPTWSDRGSNSEPQLWEASSNRLPHGAARNCIAYIIKLLIV